jgi:uncharacterized protein YndB with AHSA1/START domain
MEKTIINIETTINVPVSKAWQYFNAPEHVTNWNHASDDWHSPSGENDLRPGGSFKYRMEAKDGSFGFDFGGIYDAVEENSHIHYTMGDGREVDIIFESLGDHKTRVIESFEAEKQNPVDMQKAGWQSILDNFGKYAEQQEKA